MTGLRVSTDFETITVTVNEVNVAPVLNPMATRPGTEGSSTTFTASAVDPDIPSTLTFTLVDGPSIRYRPALDRSGHRVLLLGSDRGCRVRAYTSSTCG